MSLNVSSLKEKLNEARKNGDKQKINVLKVIIGECDRDNRADVESVIKKIIAGNNVTINLLENQAAYNESAANNLASENQLLSSFLPSYLSEQEIHNHISNLNLGTNQGKAIGIAMKYFKSNGLSVESSDVINVIQSKFQS